MLIYVSHPYGGDPLNKYDIEDIIERLVEENPHNTYISPVHCFGFMYEDVEYEQGLQYCLNLLDVCDTMLVYGDWQNSRGCMKEVEHAKIKGIKYKIIK